MATLGVTFAGAAIGLSGGSKDKKPSPPINASSADEEKFIKYVNRSGSLHFFWLQLLVEHSAIVCCESSNQTWSSYE